MKNKIMIVLLFLCALFFVGCETGNGNEETNPDNPKPEVKPEDNSEAFKTLTNLIDESIPYFVTEDLEFPMDFPEVADSYVEWETSDRDVISYDGIVKVDRFKAKEVTITYKMFIGEEERSASKTVIVTPVTMEQVAERFERQFKILITRDYEVEDVYCDLFHVDWTSSNTEVFDNEGKYHQPVDDVAFSIKYKVVCKEQESKEKEIKLTAAGVSDNAKMEEITQWLEDEILTDLYLDGNITLPSKYEKYNIPITWRSTNTDVVSENGVITHYVYERYVTLNAQYHLANGTSGGGKFECVVSPLDTKNMTKAEILDNIVSSIARKEYSKVAFGYSECPRLSTTFGHLYFYLNQPSVITDTMIPVGTSNRGGRAMDPEMVVIHDTANYRASAEANAKYCQSGYSGGTTSWHYTVGNDGIFQTLPENECGGHANGWSSQKFAMLDSGVKATVKRPQSYIGEDGFIYINKIKSKISVPNVKARYADYGLIIEIGSNGNYYVNESWYCDANGRNAVKGGNGNGIGIETSVEKGTDYLLTMRMLAKHVADILIRQKLTINRVVQHNTTSGKNCPQAIREANFWYTLKDYISLEKYLKENFPTVQFAWKSTCDIMDDTGAIALDLKNHDTVTYSVVVSDNGVKLVDKSFTTKLVASK